MLRQRSLVLVALAIAVPATAQTFRSPARETAPLCLSIGTETYRTAGPGEHADTVVRIDPAATPDIRIRFTATIDEADFVFIEGSSSAGRCVGKTVKVDTSAPADITVGFVSSSAPADYLIYVQSRSLSPEAVAAFYAAARMPARRLARANSSN